MWTRKGHLPRIISNIHKRVLCPVAEECLHGPGSWPASPLPPLLSCLTLLVEMLENNAEYCSKLQYFVMTGVGWCLPCPKFCLKRPYLWSKLTHNSSLFIISFNNEQSNSAHCLLSDTQNLILEIIITRSNTISCIGGSTELWHLNTWGSQVGDILDQTGDHWTAKPMIF